jgi:2-polyprenyl-6-methoxyphenol hydroxylase-like FAD-dependent oxidoreductase
MTRVLVIGGGVGGLALAQALQGAGVPVEVFERDAEADDWRLGYRIHVNSDGSRALHTCLPRPLWEAFTATAGHPGLGITFQTEQLAELLHVEEDLMTGGSTDPVDAHRAVSRIALRRLLLTRLNVHFGQTFERYTVNDDNTVTAHFADGTTATGDVLVGADGANSAVRGQLLPDATRRDTDIHGVAGSLALTPETRAWLPASVRNGLGIVVPRDNTFFFTAVFDGRRRTTDALSAGTANVTETMLDQVEDYVLWAFATRGALPADITPLIRHWHPDLRRVVAETNADTIRAMRFKTATEVAPWPTTRVTVLGDAIHNMTPVMGLGANTALRDAALLAHQLTAIHRGAPLLPALAEYERRMLDYGFRAMNNSRDMAHRFTSPNPLAKQAMRTWLRLCSAVPRLKRAAFSAERNDDTKGLEPQDATYHDSGHR